MGSDPVTEYCDNLFLDAYDSGRDCNVLWRFAVEAFRGAGSESIESCIVEARSAGDAAAVGEFIDIVAVAVIPPRCFSTMPPERIQRCCLEHHASALGKPTSAAAGRLAGLYPDSSSVRRRRMVVSGTAPVSLVCSGASFGVGESKYREIGSAEVGGSENPNLRQAVAGVSEQGCLQKRLEGG